MRIKEGFTLRKMVGQYIVIGEGLAQVDFNKMIAMNDSAGYLWQGVEGKDFTVEDLTKLLTDKYEVSEEQAAADAAAIAQKWIDAGVVDL
ncbi:MAG: PqqD family protein [Bacteroidales bacterium]|nr:PqqD family protein [Bacteroidales bacterium]MBR3441361.1 PqqD family protein [Bacteroidales bacterium]